MKDYHSSELSNKTPPKSRMRTLTYILLCWTALLASSLNAQRESGLDGEDHRIFRDALSLAQLGDLLEDKGAFTIFAPTDRAFSIYQRFEQEDLWDPGNRKQLKALIAYHIVAGELTASRILKALCRGEGSAIFTTVLGEPLLATLEGTDIILTDCLGNQARIVRADSGQGNLVFHEIDSVIFPATPSP